MRWLAALALALLPIVADAQQSVGNGGSYNLERVYATTGPGSQTAGVSSVYAPFACNTGNIGCSAGVLTLTLPISNGSTQRWLITATIAGNVVELAAETLTLCIANTSVSGTIRAATWGQGGSICNNALSNRAAGTPNFGNSALTGPGLAGIATETIDNAGAGPSTVTVSCNSAGSTATVATFYGFCSIEADPY